MQKFHFLNLKTILKSIAFVVAILAFTACEDSEGKGGSATIKGKIMVQEYNKDLTIQKGDPYPAQGVDVYLIYGDDEVHGDRFKTGYDGKYEFNYLKTGSYKVYALSKSLQNIVTEERIAVVKEVEITDKEQVLSVEDINIIE